MSGERWQRRSEWRGQTASSSKEVASGKDKRRGSEKPSGEWRGQPGQWQRGEWQGQVVSSSKELASGQEKQSGSEKASSEWRGQPGQWQRGERRGQPGQWQRGERQGRAVSSSKEVASGQEKQSGSEKPSGEWRGQPEQWQRGKRQGQPELKGSEEASKDLSGEEARSWSVAGPGEEQVREKVALFLKEFPAQREELKKHIRQLWEMADAIDKAHKRCTVASLAANSTSASSGILTVLGMTLAPFTAGGSLILTTAGLGLGAVATAAGLSAHIYKSVSTSNETRKAQELMRECGRSLQMAMRPNEAKIGPKLPTNNDAVGGNIKNLVCTVAAKVPDAYETVKGIKTNVTALKYVQANAGLKPSTCLANRAMEAGRAFWRKVWGSKPVEKAFSGTSLAMTKGARLLGAATAGASVLLDAYNIIQDAKHLLEGAKAETADEIRDKARKLEAALQVLNKLYEKLKKKL